MKLIIVGGVAGGASAAARARRLNEDAEIILFERGKYISFANCGLPYHIGGAIRERDRLLVQTAEGMRQRYNVDVRPESEVLSIDKNAKEVTVRDLTTGREYKEGYDKLILSPGAAPVRPPIPGADNPLVKTLRNLTDMDEIVKEMKDLTERKAVVVGGGYIGLEMAEALRERGLDVTLIELLKQVMGPADPEMVSPIHGELEANGVELRLGTSVTEFNAHDDKLDVQLSTGETLTCGLAILAVGVRPETQLAKDAGLKIGKRGGITVDEHMRTSDPDIYAVGDAVEVEDFVTEEMALIPLAGPANRQGRIAADNVFGRESTYSKTQGTAICKVFHLAIGMTGSSEKMLKAAGRKYEKVYVHPASHASYYPGASPISMKMLFDPESGKVLGAQAVGASGIDKRIDVMAMAIRSGLTVFDLEEVELSYAPPYGSAKDVVNYAGFAAANVMRGDVQICHVADVLNLNENQVLLDVRTSDEVAAGTIPGAKYIPIDELRSRLGELPRDKEILATCQVGLRGYLACRTLQQNGFKCRNLSGGYKTYLMTTGNRSQNQEEINDMRDDTGSYFANATTSAKTASKGEDINVVEKIDASGLQCPGPIQQLRQAIDRVQSGEAVSVLASDPGFRADVPAWCHTTGHELVEVSAENGGYKAVVRKKETAKHTNAVTEPSASGKRKMTIVVFNNDFDRAMAAFIIANGAAAMGYDVTLFFTFWGLNILRRNQDVDVRKNFIEKMFGWMMPRGADKLALSKMNMAGMGLHMIKGIMKRKNVASLPELIESAQKSGVRFVTCAMSMDLMGIKEEELIDGTETGGVAMYMDHAGAGNINLFI